MDPLHAPIVRVTVAEDRAFVTRVATVEVAPGLNRLHFAPLTAVVADKSLIFESDDLEILDCGVARRIKGKASEEHEFDRLLQRQQELEAEKRLLSNRKTELREFADQLLSEMADEAAWGRADLKSWQKLMGDLRKQESAVDERLSELQKEYRELSNRLKQTTRGETRLSASAYCLVNASEAGTRQLTFRYTVPCAGWRPTHLVQVTGTEMKTTSRACVWQKTGEDWADVELSFSTERTAQSTSLPKLTADRLSLKPREEEVNLAFREQEVERLEKPAVHFLDKVPGIQDGGETFELKAPGRYSLLSDGQPSKISLFDFQTTTEFVLESTPELLEQVLVCSYQTNQGSAPLLAGPVDLVRDGMLCGTGWLGFTSPQSRFELNWGPHSDLSVSRTFSSKQEKEKLLKGWVRTERKVTVFLSNRSAQEKKIRVVERIPVSESSDFKVELNRTYTHLAQGADQDGFVTWDIKLAPHQRLKIPLSYTLERKKTSSVS